MSTSSSTVDSASLVDEELEFRTRGSDVGDDFDDSDVTSSVSNSTRSLPEAVHRTEFVHDPNTALLYKQRQQQKKDPESVSAPTDAVVVPSRRGGVHPGMVEFDDVSRMSYSELNDKMHTLLSQIKKFSMALEFENNILERSLNSTTLLKMMVSFLSYSDSEIPTSPSDIMTFSKLVLMRIESYSHRLEELFELRQISLEQKILLLPVIHEFKVRSILILRGIACIAVSVTSVDVCEFEKQSSEFPYLLGMRISPFFGMVSAPQPGKVDHRAIIHAYVREKILSDGYRIRDAQICQETLTPDRYRSRFWKPFETVRDYVWRSFNRVAQKCVYDHYVKIGDVGMEAVVKMIVNKVDDIPRVKPLGNYRSFRNGIYKMDEKSAFYLYTDPMCPSDVCTECYIDQVFEPVWMKFESPLQIPTPYFDAFLKTQNISTHTRYLRDGEIVRDEKNAEVSMQNVYISFLYMMGRLLRPLFVKNDVDHKIYADNLQKVLIIVGKPGSGKSTIINLIRAMFHSSNVATLASNADKNFGLENFRNDQVKLGVCYELAKNFNIPTSVMKSMIAGEKVLINGKNLSIMDTDWNVPLVLLGNDNELPTDWGREGSNDGMVRRMALFQFKNKPKTTDLMLHTRLEKELPAILCKINRIYLEFSEMHGEAISIKLFDHPYFNDSIKRFMAQSSPIESFFSLENDQIVFGETSLVYTTMTDLWNFFLFYAEHTLKMSRQSMKYLQKRTFQEFVNNMDEESKVQIIGPMSTSHIKSGKARSDLVVCGVKIECASFVEEFAPLGDVNVLLDDKRRRRRAEVAVDESAANEEDIFDDEFIKYRIRMGKRPRDGKAEEEEEEEEEDISDYDSDF